MPFHHQPIHYKYLIKIRFICSNFKNAFYFNTLLIVYSFTVALGKSLIISACGAHAHCFGTVLTLRIQLYSLCLKHTRIAYVSISITHRFVSEMKQQWNALRQGVLQTVIHVTSQTKKSSSQLFLMRPVAVKYAGQRAPPLCYFTVYYIYMLSSLYTSKHFIEAAVCLCFITVIYQKAHICIQVGAPAVYLNKSLSIYNIKPTMVICRLFNNCSYYSKHRGNIGKRNHRRSYFFLNLNAVLSCWKYKKH